LWRDKNQAWAIHFWNASVKSSVVQLLKKENYDNYGEKTLTNI
jgi:hypothetical protein